MDMQRSMVNLPADVVANVESVAAATGFSKDEVIRYLVYRGIESTGHATRLLNGLRKQRRVETGTE